MEQYFPVPGHQIPSFARKYEIKRRTFLPLFTCFGVARRRWSWNKRCVRWGWQYNFYRKSFKAVRDYMKSTIPLYFPDKFKSHFRMTNELFTRAVMLYAHISRSSHVFSYYSLKVVEANHCNINELRFSVICQIEHWYYASVSWNHGPRDIARNLTITHREPSHPLRIWIKDCLCFVAAILNF